MKSKLIVLTIILLMILSACEITPTPTPDQEAKPEPTKTFTPEPEPAQADTAPEAQEPTPEPTATFTPTPIPCVELLTPLDLADLPPAGKVVFSWETHPEADSYSLNFIFPDGLTLNFTTDETTMNRYMDGFSMHPAYNQSGEHQWNVTALNAAGEALCQSDFLTFTKAISEIAPESAPQGDGDGGGGAGDDEKPGGGNING